MFNTFTFTKNTVGFIVERHFHKDTAASIQSEIDAILKTHECIQLYIEDANITSFSIPAVITNILYKFKNSRRFNKIAVVSDRKWIQFCAAIENLFFLGTVKSFPKRKRMDAIYWISL